MKRARAAQKFWTDEDREVVRSMYPHTQTRKVAALLRRSDRSVYEQAAAMGVRKSPEFLASAESGQLRKGECRPGCEATQFKKGQTPPNKGLRRPGWAPGRMRETQFKKGQLSGIAVRNWKPVGTILPDGEGYKRIKVRDARRGEATGFGNVKVWPLLQRHVWEQANGPIPPGSNVVFRDGDRGNVALENLELVTRADMMRRNSIHNRYPKELVDTILLAGALKRKLRNLSHGEHTQQAD